MLASPQKPRRPLALPAALPLAAACVLLLAAAIAPAAEAKVKFKISGKGYGHGVGMSQWGAYGMARGWERATSRSSRHYYRSTKVSDKAAGKQVSVLLSVRSDSVEFSGAKRGCGRSLKARSTYRADLVDGRKVRLERANGKRIASCGKKLTAVPKGKVTISGDGVYRGKLVARADSGSLNVINRLPLEAYVKGVVPNEVPSSWPAAALRAQSVAARSYALATGVDGAGFEFYDDTRSQVYGGASSEQAATNRAVRQSNGEVVTYRGKVIPTFFFSSSGGRTENVEFGFSGGTPQPYLRSVKDPYDKASPYHRWKLTLSRGRMERKLGGLLKGKLRRIEIKRTGVSPRIVKAKVVGTQGKTTVSGDDLRFALGLRSTWAKFERVRR